MDTANLLQGLTLTLLGMGVVLLSLLSIQAALFLIRQVDRLYVHLERRAAREGEASPDGHPGDEEMAVISAAVAAVLSQRHIIHHVRMVSDYSQEAWSREGRIDIMRSHTRGPLSES